MSVVELPRRRGRPPKSLEGHSETKEALIRAGVAALTEKGFAATGLDEILKEVQVPKGSFYHFFDSKEAFGAALIESYARYFAHRLDKFLLSDQWSPLECVRQFTKDAERGMKKYAYRRGCLIGNLGQEMEALPESFRRQLTDVFKDWEKRLAACLGQAQEVGEIAAHLNCARVASFFWIGWEGAVLRAKLQRKPEPLLVFSEGFFALVAA